MLLHGAEPLLVEESCDRVRQCAREQGYDERINMTVMPGFEWEQLGRHSSSMSLFANRQLLELRLPGGRADKTGAQAIKDYCAHVHADTVLMVITGRLEARTKQSAWVKAIGQQGLIVEHNPVEAERFPAWIRGRLRDRGMQADSEAVELLSYSLEGHLLAAAQEIDKLALLCTDRMVTVDRVRATIADHARFNVYTLVDTCLAGDANKALRILTTLRTSGAETVLVNWALAREVRSLSRLSAGLQQGRSRSELFKTHQVWTRRAPLVGGALKRHSLGRWWDMLRDISRLDRILKGRQAGDAWFELERICLKLCGVPTLTERPAG